VLTRIIRLLDEDEQAWVVPPPGSVTTPMAQPRASLLLWLGGHATTTLSIRRVNVRQGDTISISDQGK
jgi:hypothetical protein